MPLPVALHGRALRPEPTLVIGEIGFGVGEKRPGFRRGILGSGNTRLEGRGLLRLGVVCAR
jgi:hypothetical protein